MNLINGELLDNKRALETVDKLPELIESAYMSPDITAETVIGACERCLAELDEEKILSMLRDIGMDTNRAQYELAAARTMMSREYMTARIDAELGAFKCEREFEPACRTGRVQQRRRPLGVLFHVAAGNVDALPAYSVIEGLLTGNINILKLPSGENGLSVYILGELIKAEPALAPYIYVYDFPSSDIELMKTIADVADAVVVWGSDEAIKTARTLLTPNTQIIEWGHKISFAYVSGEPSNEEIMGLCENMVSTGQILCSSCQGVYIDTENIDEARAFAKRLLKALDSNYAQAGRTRDVGMSAKVSLELYTDELENTGGIFERYAGENADVALYGDRRLATSYGEGFCWVKMLPRKDILKVLLPYKNYLQTAALICADRDKKELEELLAKTGIVKISDGRGMSEGYCGEPHDGHFPLSRYTKIVSVSY